MRNYALSRNSQRRQRKPDQIQKYDQKAYGSCQNFNISKLGYDPEIGLRQAGKMVISSFLIFHPQILVIHMGLQPKNHMQDQLSQLFRALLRSSSKTFLKHGRPKLGTYITLSQTVENMALNVAEVTQKTVSKGIQYIMHRSQTSRAQNSLLRKWYSALS